MILGVLSDTHGQIKTTERAIRLFAEKNVTEIIHCGDIGGENIVTLFQDIPTHFVLGNMDVSGDAIDRVARTTGGFFYQYFGSLKRENKRIAFLHGHQSDRFSTELDSGLWDLICFGHTHTPTFERHGNTHLLNPGALYRVATPTIAIVRLPEIEVELLTL